MTPEQFVAHIHKLIDDGREGGLSDEVMIKVLEDAAEALDEGLS